MGLDYFTKPCTTITGDCLLTTEYPTITTLLQGYRGLADRQVPGVNEREGQCK